MGGWVKPQLGFFFFNFVFFVLLSCFKKFPSKNKKLDKGLVGVVRPIRVFLRFF